MSNRTGRFEVFFDYTCPFAYRAHRWLQLVDVDTVWRPFSLLEQNYRGEGPPVWRLAERADDISLLLFAGHEWVLSQHGDIDGYRRAAFAQWHDSDVRLAIGDVMRLAVDAGAQGDESMLRAHFFDAEAEHDAARALGVFGSPTLVFGLGQAAYVKLDRVPAADRALRVLDAVATMSELPSLVEVKRPQPPTEPDANHLRAEAS